MKTRKLLSSDVNERTDLNLVDGILNSEIVVREMLPNEESAV